VAERYHRHTMPLYWAPMEGVDQRGFDLVIPPESGRRRVRPDVDSAHTPMQYLFDKTVVVRFSDGRNPGFIEAVVGSELELAA
jgi:hypothetical protein